MSQLGVGTRNLGSAGMGNSCGGACVTAESSGAGCSDAFKQPLLLKPVEKASASTAGGAVAVGARVQELKHLPRGVRPWPSNMQTVTDLFNVLYEGQEGLQIPPLVTLEARYSEQWQQGFDKSLNLRQ